MDIRRATDDDLDELCRLRLAFIAEVRDLAADAIDDELVTATRAFLADVTSRGRCHSWLAADGGVVSGLVSVVLADVPPLPDRLEALEGYVINMYVAPAARRQGVGRQLLDHVVAAAPSLGLRRLYLYATEDGRLLYEATGFRPNPRFMARPIDR